MGQLFYVVEYEAPLHIPLSINFIIKKKLYCVRNQNPDFDQEIPEIYHFSEKEYQNGTYSRKKKNPDQKKQKKNFFFKHYFLLRNIVTGMLKVFGWVLSTFVCDIDRCHKTRFTPPP